MKLNKKWKTITRVCMVTVMIFSLCACGNVSETNNDIKETSLPKDSDFAETEIKENSNSSSEPMSDDNQQEDDKTGMEKSGNTELEENNDTEQEKNSNTEPEGNDNKKPEENNNSNQENTENEYTDLSRFYGYNLPLSVFFNYEEEEDGSWKFSIADYGDYYVVNATLEYAECVAQDVFWGADIGQHFETGSGRGYTVICEESYNNDQRQKRILLGDDGVTYEVSNLPASSVDVYTWQPYYIITKEDGTCCKTYFEDVKIRLNEDMFFSDGETTGQTTFGEYIKSGALDSLSEEMGNGYNFDIHFTEDGTVDIFNVMDYGQNGEWRYGSNMEIWREKIE